MVSSQKIGGPGPGPLFDGLLANARPFLKSRIDYFTCILVIIERPPPPQDISSAEGTHIREGSPPARTRVVEAELPGIIPDGKLEPVLRRNKSSKLPDTS